MTILDRLITDRTQEDVEWARTLGARGWSNMTQTEREAFLGGLKGCYGPTDMNRVREALEYIDHLMRDAKREGAYVPVIIPHAEYTGTLWRHWNDKVWVDSDYPTPELWAAYLGNINRMWAAARRFEAVALARYDPDGNGYIAPDTVVDAGKMFTVTDSFGLLELRVEAVCPLEITAKGTAWTVSGSETGWTAVLNYTDCPYPDISDALAALKISCETNAAVVDSLFTLSATLRYDYEVTAGSCAIRWSPFLLWGEAREQYETWDGAKPLTWGGAARGGTA